MYSIEKLSNKLNEKIQHKIDFKTKPQGALGTLEEIALQVCKIQNTLSPNFEKPHLLVFAGDHGIAKTGLVNPFPQEVTFQMMMNFVAGGAAVNVFAKQNGLQLKVIDAGVNYDFSEIDGVIDSKIAMGTTNYLTKAAMTSQQCELSLKKGAEIVESVQKSGSNVVGFGEMGISNTSSASLIMSALCGIPIEDCVGRGTGVNNEKLLLKVTTLEEVQSVHSGISNNPIEVLQTFGGFEIAQMVGAMLKAAELKITILVDGFITTAAVLVAHSLNKNILDYCIFTHQSGEQGHVKMLEFLEVKAVLSIGMRLGEGSGVAVAYPVIKSALEFVNQMASFEDAGVSGEV
ncbi:nicotinate-nucleotide--dimethylbenzimidazole phosphoribosyltransferase [Fibrobacterales bacterium]|nr:nicotinate-nucleotide--dimethylbenzimidazole phosphoribosyltransferase [Fibrobacterales bacterium]